ELPDASVLPLVHRSNTFGALDMGVAPTLLPGRVSTADADRAAALAAAWGSELPDGVGSSTGEMLSRLAAGEMRALILVGADPVRDVPSGVGAEAVSAADFVVALDQFMNDSSELADVILPVEGFAEKEGTVTNLEGRVQKVNRLIPGPGQARADWSVLDEIATRLGRPINLASAETISKEISDVAPAYAGITWEMLDWDAREGAVVPLAGATQPLQFVPVDPGLTAEESATALHLARTLYDDGVLMRNSQSLHQLAPGAAAHLDPTHAASLGVEDGDRVSVNGVTMPVVIDETLANGVVYVPFNQPAAGMVGAEVLCHVAPAGGST
ncbi:MAG: molybdopterin-dependent oxidoreductase, partial [Acidimicrobiia bacterium]|nr:molybdopterin-dependent oxidoreductase [Acidimicrobiia bacterium]